MSSAPTKSIGLRVVKFLLGSDQPSFVAAAVGASIGWGSLLAFHIVYGSPAPAPPLWQTIGFGLAMGLFLMPFLFMAVSRTMRFMSPWEALATLSAAGVCPVIMWHLGAREGLGVHPILLIAICIGLIAAAFLIARLIEKRRKPT